MLRAVGGLFLGFAFVFLAVFWVRTCLPNPNEEEIDWLHREDVIVTQMMDAGRLRVLGTRTAEPVPYFTLYGDGTLIFMPPPRRVPSPGEPLREVSISERQIRDLLEFLSDEGFFDFTYEQPHGSGEDFPTTYLYAKTSTKANAISVNALAADHANKEADSEQFQRLKRIQQRLDAIAGDAARSSTTLIPEKVVLFVQGVSDAGTSTSQWSVDGIDLSSIAPETGIGETIATGVTIPDILENVPTLTFGANFLQDGQPYAVWYRPVLPYEENFPEFEPPSPP